MSKSKSRIYLSPPHMCGEELNFIQDAFDKNWIAPLGENVDGFEKDLTMFTGRDHAAAVITGTSAIHLGLILLGVEAGDEVICQSFTFAATANPIRYQNAVPVFVDSEAETWNMDPELLSRAISDRVNKTGKKPKAIIIVHLYGMPAKVDEIMEVAANFDIPVIEDAAEALGSSYKGKKCGKIGRLSILSFNGNKIITTSGGGAILSDDKELVDKARFLATQARDEAPHYQHSELGFNYRMSNIVAGIGRGQMKVLDKRISARRENHDFYFNNLIGNWFEFPIDHSSLWNNNSSNSGLYFLKEPKGFFSNRWLTTILVNPRETGGVTREDIRLELMDKNIESRPLWKPMHIQPYYKKYPFYGNGLSDMLFEYGLCLPSGSNLTESERAGIVDLILNKVR